MRLVFQQQAQYPWKFFEERLGAWFISSRLRFDHEVNQGCYSLDLDCSNGRDYDMTDSYGTENEIFGGLPLLLYQDDLPLIVQLFKQCFAQCCVRLIPKGLEGALATVVLDYLDQFFQVVTIFLD